MPRGVGSRRGQAATRGSLKPVGRRSVPDAATARRQHLADRAKASEIAERARREDEEAERAAAELLRGAREDAER